MLRIPEYYVLPEVIENLYNGIISIPERDCGYTIIEYNMNSFVLLRSVIDEKHTALVRYGVNGWSLVRARDLKFQNIVPKDLHQLGFMNTLADDSILLSTAIGPAGTGKSTIALAYAWNQYQINKRSIILSKPACMVGMGRAFGIVPGNIQEKYAPYLESYEIVLRKILGPRCSEYLERMKLKQEFQFMPLEFTRGCTFENCTLILDESQNTTFSELNTLITRMGENSKIVLLGDLNQIDIRVPKEETGLYKLLQAEPFRKSSLTSAIELTGQYRSPIVQLMIEINEWVQNES